MYSEKIVSIFFFFVSFLILFHESHARTQGIGSPLSSPSPSPAPVTSNEDCWLLSTSCRNGSLTACIDPSSTASKELVLLVKNDGETPLNVNVTHSLPKHIVQELHIPGHQIEKVNISANPGKNSSIQLEAGNLECEIRIGSQGSGGGIFYYIPFAMHITPINPAYLLVLTGLIFCGIAWTCYKRGERGQQGEGIRYRQLEMEQPDSLSVNNVEATEGWEQDWGGDTDWDELKSKAAIGHQMANGSANSLTSRLPKRDDREKYLG